MSIDVRAVIELLTALNEGHVDIHDLVSRSGFKRESVVRWLSRLREEKKGIPKLVRICDWQRNYRGPPTPYYEWNAEGLPDAPAPKPKTPIERSRESRKRLKLVRQTTTLGSLKAKGSL